MHLLNRNFIAALLAAIGAPVGASHYPIKTSINTPEYKAQCTLYGAIHNINNQNNADYPECAPGTPANTISIETPLVLVTHEMRLITGVAAINGGTLVGSGKTRLMRVSGAATLLASHMHFFNGNASDGSGGAFLVEGEANLDLLGVGFHLNRATSDGGAVAFESNGKFNSKFVSYEYNTAGANGGALMLAGSTPAGGAAAAVRSSSFKYNQATREGGAVFCRSPQRSAVVTLSNFEENLVIGQDGTGGAVSSYCNSDITISRMWRNANDRGRGGAVYLAGPLSSLLDVNIDSNEAAKGGGVYLDGAATVLRGGIRNNGATEGGGGIYVADAAGGKNVQIANVTLHGNKATWGGEKKHGAAIWFTGLDFPLYDLDPRLGYQPYSAEVLNNTVSDNVGLEQVYLHPGAQNFLNRIFFVNNIVASNDVPGCGGLVYRLQLRRPNSPAVQNIQYPGASCNGATDAVPEYLAPLAPAQAGGLLGQVYRGLPVLSPLVIGDPSVCQQYPVFGQDQFRTPRECLLGAVEVPLPPVIPAEFYP